MSVAGVVIATAAALAGCAHSPPVELIAAADGSGCRFEAGGRALTEAALARAARGWRGRRVDIVAGIEVPFKCFGLAISTLQGEGVERISFTAEPRPGPE